MKLKNQMKTRNLILAFGVAVLATVNVMATDTYLSPRAKDNQIKVVSGTNTDPNLTAAAPSAVSPRFAENQIKTVAGTDAAASPAMNCAQKMSGTPKMVTACAEHPGADMPCCSVAANQ
jgi:hypothetical protein